VVGPPSLLLCFSRSRSSPPRLNKLVTLRPSMVTSSTSSPSEKEIECDLRPASVLIFQRQGDWGAGAQLDKMKTMKKVVNRVARGRGDGDDEGKLAVVKMMGNLSTVMMGKARLASWRKMKLTPS